LSAKTLRNSRNNTYHCESPAHTAALDMPRLACSEQFGISEEALLATVKQQPMRLGPRMQRGATVAIAT